MDGPNQPGAAHYPRRSVLRGALLGGAALVGLPLLACSEEGRVAATGGSSASAVDGEAAPPPSAPTPEPVVLPEGRQTLVLMAGTPYETPAHVFGSGLPGRVALVLGGVHGNEPGGWLAAERLLGLIAPTKGAVIVIPRANKVATNLFERTTAELGDLNRLYPGDPDGLPMARMAFEVVALARDLHVSLVLDMHESWAFYRDRPPTGGTAYLGQTVSTPPEEPGSSFVREVVEAVNARVLHAWEEFTFRGFPGPMAMGGSASQGGGQGTGGPGGRSSLGLGRHLPGLQPILVEMGQQQALERRVALHVDVALEVLQRAEIMGT
jgi:hypothetical protein